MTIFIFFEKTFGFSKKKTQTKQYLKEKKNLESSFLFRSHSQFRNKTVTSPKIEELRSYSPSPITFSSSFIHDALCCVLKYCRNWCC